METNQCSGRKFTAEIISIGDEIISGNLVDTNSAYLSRELSELGIPVMYHSAAGDSLEDIEGMFRTAVARSELVIATGGIGPTEDDLTRQAAAKAAEVELVQEMGAMEHIRRLFAIRGRAMPASNEIQSFFPEGAKVIVNPHGTAPGFELVFETGEGGNVRKSKLMVFPGVPSELREMWSGSARQAVADWEYAVVGRRRYLQVHTIRTFGAGESDVESRLPRLIARGHVPRVGITAAQGIISIRIFAEGASPEECREQIRTTSAVVRERLGSLVFGEGEETLPSVVGGLLAARGHQLATLEWGTRGFMAGMVPPEVFGGGMVDSGDGTILRTLALEPDASLETVLRAYHARFGTEAVIAVGAFPPVEENELKTRFHVPVAVLWNGEYREATRPYGLQPAVVKPVYAYTAFNLLRSLILENGLVEGEDGKKS